MATPANDSADRISAQKHIVKTTPKSQRHAIDLRSSRQADAQHSAESNTSSLPVSAVKPSSSRSRVRSRANAATTKLSQAPARPSIEYLKLAQILLSTIPSQTLPLLGSGISAHQLGQTIIAFVSRHYDRASVDAVKSQGRQLAIEADAEWKAEFYRSRPPEIYNKATRREELLASSRELVASAAFRRQMALAGEAVRNEDGEGTMVEELEDIAREARLRLWRSKGSAGECV
ncbi:hypothetical protein EJ03DRAFT_69001 [Teratosphaeria nubilosa]|uniref:Uncharacterized protein n=1 Tax=Teratosphaeria nubilosa TaxID=161662 RepID=A0A6G1LNP8_9PEZI|nr:hypothetical protein EJ03DRAFT_69001 [Teratosphaeria nubilosa]